MKFGSVNDPENIDFTLPKDHSDTYKVLNSNKNQIVPKIHVGCAKWNKADLKGFYPKGTKDELVYYASQFNSIELNATFYRIFSADQFTNWYSKTPTGFKFFPKIFQDISHWKRLNGVDAVVKDYLYNVSHLKEKLGTIFLQMHNNFTPKNFDLVSDFIEKWPKDIPLAIEFRHTDWYNNKEVSTVLYKLLEEHNISNIIVDTAGRRDIMHMRLTNTSAFIRFVGANHASDYQRLDDWVQRLKIWKSEGIQEINFFIHQNIELESPLLATYFINEINEKLDYNIKLPNSASNQISLL
ncbi:MAG: DUF72 domain-containing protein [Bizionia sp.]|nr:DUF72 domain-containing protein [Bizionia sp.]